MALLTPRSAADRLGVSYSTLKQWIYKGLVRTTVTGGGHHRVDEREVDRLATLEGEDLGTGTGARAGASGAAKARGNAGKAGTAGKAGRAPAKRRRPGVLVALSGRNQLRGIVEEVRVDGLLAQVRLRIGDQRLTAVITRDAVDELRLKRGQTALAVIKATEVMIAREAD